MNLKRIMASMLLLVMLFTAVSCSDKSNESSDNPQGITPGEEPVDNGDVNAGMTDVTDDYVEPIKIPELDTTKDKKEYSDGFKDLDVTGGTHLTKKSESGILGLWPKGMYDVDDNVMLVYSDDDLEVSTLLFKLIDPTTGEQLSSMVVDVYGEITSIDDIRGDSRYGDNRDIKLNTSRGTYFFDFDNLKAEPEEFLIDDVIREQSGKLVIEDHLGTLFDLSGIMYDMDVPGERVVYANNEGVFIVNFDGSGSEKITNQPKNKRWYSGSDLAIGTDGKMVAGNTMAVYASPRFMDNGKKIFCQIINYSTNNSNIGFAVIDVDSGEVYENVYYDKKSETGKLTNWDNFEITFVGPTVLNETQIVLTETYMNIAEQNVYRHDIVFDVTTNSVLHDMDNRGGLTKDFEVLVANEVKPGGDLNATEVTFVDMKTNEEKGGGVKHSESGTVLTTALSEKYALTTFYKPIEGSDDKEAYIFLVEIPR